jgi:hypothetical protein
MFKKFITLEWKSFFRSASFGTNLALKILMGLGAIYFIVCFAALGTAVYFILKDEGLEPLETINRFMIYYLAVDLLIRYFLQKMPVMNIRPLLTLPIKRGTIVHFQLASCLFLYSIYYCFIDERIWLSCGFLAYWNVFLDLFQ